MSHPKSNLKKELIQTDIRLASEIATSLYGHRPEMDLLASSKHRVCRLRFSTGESTRSHPTLKILKLSPHPEDATLKKELKVIALLAQQGVPAPLIEHADMTGTLAGRAFFIMQSAGDTSAMDCLRQLNKMAREVSIPTEIKEQTQAQAAAIFTEMGTLLARIHSVTLPESGYIQHDKYVPQNAATYHKAVCDRVLTLAAQRILTPSEAAVITALPSPNLSGNSLCHNDFHPAQCIVDNGHIATAVDWQEAWSGNAIIDVAIAHAYLDFYCPASLVKCFLRGYIALRPLPETYHQTSLPIRLCHTVNMISSAYQQGQQSKMARALKQYNAYYKLFNT